VEVEGEPVVKMTVYGGTKEGVIDNGTKKEGSKRKEWGKFQTTVIAEKNISDGIR